jgi:hypothetical protein
VAGYNEFIQDAVGNRMPNDLPHSFKGRSIDWRPYAGNADFNRAMFRKGGCGYE